MATADLPTVDDRAISPGHKSQGSATRSIPMPWRSHPAAILKHCIRNAGGGAAACRADFGPISLLWTAVSPEHGEVRFAVPT